MNKLMSNKDSISNEEELNIVDAITIFKYKSDDSDNYSQFIEKPTTSGLIVDEDNDLVLPRRKIEEKILRIEYSNFTDINSVGLQVWNGALLLAEFIISQKQKFENKRVLELGSGTGFVSIVATKYCAEVTCTDKDNATILNLIKRNFENNQSYIKANYHITPFDFSKEIPADVTNVIENVDIIIASELIYDNELSESLINTLVKILQRRPNIFIYISVEKRYVFTLHNRRVECKHYEYFFDLLKKTLQNLSRHYKLSQVTDIPQYFYEYERSNETELWCIWSQ